MSEALGVKALGARSAVVHNIGFHCKNGCPLFLLVLLCGLIFELGTWEIAGRNVDKAQVSGGTTAGDEFALLSR